MLEIQPIGERAAQEALCRLCGILYRAELPAYGATEDGRPIGICQFTVSGETGTILDLAAVSDDAEVRLCMGHAVLRLMEQCRVETVCFAAQDKATATALGFSEQDGRLCRRLGASGKMRGKTRKKMKSTR